MKTITLKQWLVDYAHKGGQTNYKIAIRVFGRYPTIKKLPPLITPTTRPVFRVTENTKW